MKPRFGLTRLSPLVVGTCAYIVQSIISIFNLKLVAPFLLGRDYMQFRSGELNDWVWYDVAARRSAEAWGRFDFDELASIVKSDLFVGINGFFYWVFGGDAIALVPWYSLLSAITAVSIWSISRKIHQDDTLAILPIVPCLFFPTTSFLFSHPLKDPYFISGIFLFFSTLPVSPQVNQKWRTGHACLLASLILVFVSRPYILPLLLLCILILVLWRLFKHHRFSNGEPSIRLGSLLLLLVVGMWLMRINSYVSEKAQSSQAQATQAPRANPSSVRQSEWQHSTLVPPAIDSMFQTLSRYRDGYRNTNPGAATAIDTDQSFSRIWDVICYLPRAIQIGLLAPFPDSWTGDGSQTVGRRMRQLAGVEMAFVYFCLVGWIAFLAVNFRRAESMWGSLFSVAMLTLFALIVTNVGTLYRMRHAFTLYVLTVGFSQLLLWAKRSKLA